MSNPNERSRMASNVGTLKVPPVMVYSYDDSEPSCSSLCCVDCAKCVESENWFSGDCMSRKRKASPKPKKCAPKKRKTSRKSRMPACKPRRKPASKPKKKKACAKRRRPRAAPKVC